MSDSVDLFGLDEFGQPMGDFWQYGAAIGAAAQTGGAMLARHAFKNPKMFEYSELVGAGLSAAVGAGLYFMGERTAGMSTALAGVISGGLRQLEFKKMLGKAVALAAGATHGWGDVVVNPAALVPGSQGMMGLGLPTVERSASLNGLGALPQLVGDYGLSANPGAQQVQVQGGPSISGLGAHYGATLFA